MDLTARNAEEEKLTINIRLMTLNIQRGLKIWIEELGSLSSLKTVHLRQQERQIYQGSLMKRSDSTPGADKAAVSTV